MFQVTTILPEPHDPIGKIPLIETQPPAPVKKEAPKEGEAVKEETKTDEQAVQ